MQNDRVSLTFRCHGSYGPVVRKENSVERYSSKRELGGKGTVPSLECIKVLFCEEEPQSNRNDKDR